MTPQAAYDEFLRRAREEALLDSCQALLGWDELTYMPPGGVAARANQLAYLAGLHHEKATDPRIGELLAAVEGSDLASEPLSAAAVNVREIHRIYNRLVRLPRALVEELARIAPLAQQQWATSRQEADFASFCPWLEKIVALQRQEAECLGYEHGPYDALLENYEPGARAADIARLFTALRAELTPLIVAIAGSRRRRKHAILKRNYPVERQHAFAMDAASALGFDFQRGRVDTSVHPFSAHIGPGDCRIAIRYSSNYFSDAFFALLHEVGHGLYEQGLDPEHEGTPLGSISSVGLHESQSRLWENQVGRSRPFWEHFFSQAKSAFPAALGDVSLDNWLFAINDVRPSFIRVEADEATYNMHIILRFELEQGLVSGDLKPADVPGAWAEKFRKFFDLAPPSDAQGSLQDIHWSFGGIGYFPTYTLGNLYAAQFMEQARTDLPNLDTEVRRGEFSGLKKWLNDKIHAHGQRWRARDLCRRVTGRDLSPAPLMRYLKGKYAELYGL